MYSQILLKIKSFLILLIISFYFSSCNSSSNSTSESTNITPIVQDPAGSTSISPLSVVLPSNCKWTTGQSLDFKVVFGTSIQVTGTPRISLSIGNTTKYAEYFSGSGTTELVFRYIIQMDDTDTDGVSVLSQIELNGGQLTTSNSEIVNLTLPNSLNTTEIQIAQLSSNELRGHWKLNESSGLIFSDSGPYSISTTTVGAPEWILENGRYNLKFNGTSDWLTAGNPIQLRPTEGITISAWFKPQSDYSMLVSHGNHNNYYLLFTDRHFAASLRYPSNITITTTEQYNLDQWYHVAMTYNRTALKIYVNGLEVISTPLTPAIGYSGLDPGFRIGTYLSYGAPWAPTNGSIRDVRIYGIGQNDDFIKTLSCGL